MGYRGGTKQQPGTGERLIYFVYIELVEMRGLVDDVRTVLEVAVID